MIGFGGFLGSKGVKGRGGTQNLAQTRKGEKIPGKEKKTLTKALNVFCDKMRQDYA